MTTETPQPPAPRRRFGFVALVVAGLVGALVSFGATVLTRPAATTAPSALQVQQQERWQCPMHPTVVQDHPGNCPICGMKLVKMSPASTDSGPERHAEHKVLFYRSPMNPKQTSPTPRKDEMGMDYLPVYADEQSAATVDGLSTVNIDPARQQLIGLTTVAVERGPVGGQWRTVGAVAVDETRVRHVNVKVSGFVEKVFVDYLGKPVRKGDPLFTIYSPELYTAQEEYLLALRTQRSLASAGMQKNGEELVSSARRKLLLWDVSDADIKRLEQRGTAERTLTVYSPISGVVVRKDVVDGMKLDAGAMPYEIVDLSEVWVLADVYENELRFVKRGMKATLHLKAFPDRPFEGKVAFIDPLLDPKTRTVKVRLEFANPNGDLRPEMFGEVILHGESHQGLRVPTDAVIDSGTRKVVFVSLGEGKFQPREVKLGEDDGTYVEVLEGLSDDEKVVTRANFLVDSESRLKASLSAMPAKPAAPEEPRTPAPSTDHAHGGM